MSLNQKQIRLLIGLPIVVGLLIVIFPVLTSQYGKIWGFLLSLSIYWLVVCFGFSCYILGFRQFARLYKKPFFILGKSSAINGALTLFPILMVFVAVYLKIFDRIGGEVLLLAAVFALINGSLEELLWRGVFVRLFPDNIKLAFVFPTLLFAIWHIAMALAKDVIYEGGVVNLIGGGLFLGLIWGYLTWRTRSIFLSTISHVATNFFAFTGLLYTNYFM